MPPHSNEPATKGDIEELAQLTQRELLAIKEKVASKEDIGRILQGIADLDLHLTATASNWREDFDTLKKRVAKIEAHLHLNS